MVAVEFRAELEDTDLDRTLAARLSCRPVGRLPGVHGREATGCARQVSVLPRRGPLGAATAQSPPVVGNGARLDRSVLEARADGSPLVGGPFLKTLTRTKIGRAHAELQSQSNLVCRLLLEKKTSSSASPNPTANRNTSVIKP